MKSILIASCSLALACISTAKGEEKKPSDCKLCDAPTGRAALLAGKKECPEGCQKLCCAGTEVSYVVAGMTCEACSGKVEAALARIEGVTVDAVCHASGHAVMKYDPARVKADKLIAAINATGFKVTGEKLKFDVAGMTCGGCSSKLDAALAKTAGVSAVDKVCHQGGCAVVTIDPAKTDRSKVEAAINASGFKVGKDG